MAQLCCRTRGQLRCLSMELLAREFGRKSLVRRVGLKGRRSEFVSILFALFVPVVDDSLRFCSEQ